MRGTGTNLWIASMLLLAAATAARAGDDLVPGTRLELKVSSSGSEKLSFQSVGSFMIPTPGSPGDPALASPTLQILNPNTGESFTFDLPGTHWSTNSAGTAYNYRDNALVESGKVKSASLGARKLKVSGRKIGITLNENSQGELDVVLASGSFRYCARFADGSVRRDGPGVFSAKGAPPPSACLASTGTTTTSTTISQSTTTTLASTTTTQSPATTTTVTVPVTTTTMTIPLPPVGMLTFTISQGSSTCGGPGFSPPAAAPFSGEVDNKLGTKVGDLGTGCLYPGGGSANALPPVAIPAGATSVLAVTGVSSGVALTLGGSPGSGPGDCTLGAGPGMHCLNGAAGSDGNGTCSSDADCGQADACALDPNCFFGPPVPLPTPATPATSTCIVNVIAVDVSGAANLLTRATTLNASLAPQLYLTGDATSPCPQCVSGVCTAGQRQGMACSGGIGSVNTTVECPPSSTQFVGRLAVSLSPLTTGTATMTTPDGLFCPDQAQPGAFGRFSVRTITENGSPLLGTGSPFATTLAGIFCIPATGSDLVNALADLPGPAAISVSGTVSVQLF